MIKKISTGSSGNSSPTNSNNFPRPSFESIHKEKPRNLVFTRYESISGHRKVFNFNRYSTIKTTGMGLLVASLVVLSSFKIRRLLYTNLEEKWKYPLLGFLLFQLIVLIFEECLLVFLGLLDVRNPSKQRLCSKANIISSVLVSVVSVLNLITNHICDEEIVRLESSCT